MSTPRTRRQAPPCRSGRCSGRGTCWRSKHSPSSTESGAASSSDRSRGGSMSVRTVGVDERRARLALRHHLAPAARRDDVVELARDLVALHSTDPASVYLSALARMRTPSLEAVDRALYEDRTLVRML